MSGSVHPVLVSAQLSLGWMVPAAAVIAAGWMALCAGRILRRLPEPAEPPAEPKTAYRDLPTRPFVAACIAVAAVCAALSGAAVPSTLLPLWLVLATFGVLLAAVDLATTWLPRRLCRLAWLATALAVVLCLLLGAGLPAGVRAGLGAVAAGAVYGLIWLVSRGGIGFGDVRFAPLIGAPAAADSWTLLIWALLAGSLLGAVHGLIQLALRRGRSFPYAPAMLLGAYLALLAARLV